MRSHGKRLNRGSCITERAKGKAKSLLRVLDLRTVEITAAAECDLLSELDLTGGFSAFHRSWFSFGIQVSRIADEASQMQSTFALALGLRCFGIAPSFQFVGR
jgi:hypothetical protein